jgi:hypothetical protein
VNQNQEIAYLGAHPVRQLKRRKAREFATNDEFGKIREDGDAATIGEFIKLDIAPRILHIRIFGGITEKALSILSERLVEHIKSGATKIMLKRSVKKGTFAYSNWLTVKDLEKMTLQQLLSRLLALTKQGTKTVQLIVRQNIERGYIQDLWQRKHSLL